MSRIPAAAAAVFLAAALATSGALAATVTNRDDTAHVIVISEGGTQTDMTIAPGETVSICPAGCFVTMPNGDREVLTGTETLEIEASRGKIF